MGIVLSIPAQHAEAVGSRPARIAVIDTGITPIPALVAALDTEHGRTFVAGVDTMDPHGHGTGMASIIHAATPEARIVPIKALDPAGGTTDDILARAITYSVAVGVRVINLSVAGAQPLPAVRRAILAADQAGVVVVVAAGNNSADLADYPSYPASYRLPNLAVVTARNASGGPAPYANGDTRPTAISVVATAITTCTKDGQPDTVRGTSAAAAVVAAHAATLADEFPTATPRQLVARLVDSPHAVPEHPCGRP